MGKSGVGTEILSTERSSGLALSVGEPPLGWAPCCWLCPGHPRSLPLG